MEYGLYLAGISIGIIALILVMRDEIADSFNDLSNELASIGNGTYVPPAQEAQED